MKQWDKVKEATCSELSPELRSAYRVLEWASAHLALWFTLTWLISGKCFVYNLCPLSLRGQKNTVTVSLHLSDVA